MGRSVPTSRPAHCHAAGDPEPPRSDADLVLASRAGDREAFALLYDRYAGLVRAVAYDASRGRADANELAQEAFVRAYCGLDSLRDPSRLLPWLVQITRHVALESLRSNARRRRLLDRFAGQASPRGDTPAEALERNELRDAVAELPEPDRTAIRLFYLCEQPAERARGVLGLSRSGFYKALERARQTLRQKLDPEPRARA